MNRVRVYSDCEIQKLLQNPNVVRIKNKKQIVYSNSFKLWAVNEILKHPCKTSRQIFEEAGFDMNILSADTPSRRILEWTRLYNRFGEKYFDEENKYTFGTECKKESVKKEEHQEKTDDIEIICSDDDCVVIVICDEETDC